MEFTTSYSSRRRSGFTIAEMLIALGAGSLVLAAVASMSIYTARTMQMMVQYSDMEQENQRVLDSMSQTIRSADRITAFTSTSLTLLSQGQTISYGYNAGTKTLTQSIGGTNTVLLTNVQSLGFSVYARNVSTNSFNQFLSSGTNTAKAVIVNWVSRDQVVGTAQTETVRSARIVVRNNPS
ncbi:MAG: hypothetical protein HC841_02985 [Verrucomicrobiae bacterium]|nr:hypothetical protein [Verrucomicrobiae bacterium]